jgi:hypothetical protein
MSGIVSLIAIPWIVAICIFGIYLATKKVDDDE